MRRFLIICLAAVFTLPAADANTIFWKKKKDKTEKKEKKLSKYESCLKTRRWKPLKVCSLYILWTRKSCSWSSQFHLWDGSFF